uniref:Complex 1 LYR protein domain-containing protein n=1 Tax=Globisporangium ultimum (strain ATCC 200006 / CBS 805.95 / DAOM BR144) TaxID=431595 RepID=K3XAH8_GLOUD
MPTNAAAPKRVYKSLQYFLNRSNVLAQYRQFLRTTIPLEPDVRTDVRKQIRDGFEMYRDLDDDNHVGRLLRQSKDQLKMVSDLVDSAVARQRIVTSPTASSAGVPPKMALRVPEHDSMVHRSSSNKDTWMEQGENDNPDDVKGRVGTGWPWKSNKPVKKLELEGIKRRYNTVSFLDEQ